MSRPNALAALDPAYGPLYDRLVAAALAAGATSVEPGGSLARGDADPYSDLDLVVRAAEPEALDAAAIVRATTPTVLLRTPPFGVTAITPDWLRLDILVAGTDDAMPAPRAPDITALSEEFLRVLGLLPVVAGRGEWIVASDGAWLLRTLLIQLLLAANGRTELTGVKRLNDKLTAEQRDLVESLPPIVASRDGVLEGQLAVAAVFLPLARKLAGDWPEALEQATRSYLSRELGIELPST